MNLLVDRRTFTTGMAVTIVLGALGCAGKNKGKEAQTTEMPTAEVGGVFKRFHKRINKVVKDKRRKKAAKAELEKIEKAIMKIDVHFREMRAELAGLPKEARDTMAELQPINVKFADRMVETLLEATQSAVDMRKHVTETEWPQIFPPEAT